MKSVLLIENADSNYPTIGDAELMADRYVIYGPRKVPNSGSDLCPCVPKQCIVAY